MTTKREQIFEALLALWTGSPFASVQVKRNDVLPERLDSGANPLLIQQDGGDPPAPVETFLSPVAFVYDEMVELQIVAQGSVASTTSVVDGIVASVGTALAAARTLGGLADDARAIEAPKITDKAIGGAQPLRIASVKIRIQWSVTDPLS